MMQFVLVEICCLPNGKYLGIVTDTFLGKRIGSEQLFQSEICSLPRGSIMESLLIDFFVKKFNCNNLP